MFIASDVLRLDGWKSVEDIFDNVRIINDCCYEKIFENLKFIQSHDKEIYTAYSIELRDAYSHMVKIFEANDFSSEEKIVKINRQQERYLGHLEEMLYDTYLRRIQIKLDSFYNKIKGKREITKKKMEYALQVSQLRTMSDDISIKQKIEKYEKIIDLIDKEKY